MASDLGIPLGRGERQAGVLARSRAVAGSILALLLVAIVYTVVARVSLVFRDEATSVAAIWPPAGLAMGALLATPRRRWPIILAGIGIAVIGANLSVGNSISASLGFAVANTMEPLLGAAALRRLRFGSLTSVRDVGLFLVCGALAAPLAGATVGGTVVAASFGSAFGTSWVQWAFGHAAGIFAVAPLLILPLSGSRALVRNPRHVLEAIGLEAALVGLTAATFLAPVDGVQLSSYPIFILLVMIAVRFGVPGATLATAQVSALVVIGTLAGSGPIAGLNQARALHIGQAQIMVTVIFLTTFVTAAALAERRGAIGIIDGQRRALADRAARSERLTAFARDISATLDEESVAHHIAQAATRVIHADIVQFTMRDPDGTGHIVRAALGAPGAVGQEIHAGDGVAGAVIRDRKPVTFDRCQPEDRGTTLVDIEPQEPLAFTCVPLIRNGHVVATLGLARTDLAQPFTDDERDALGMMAELSAIALGNVSEHAVVSERSIRDALTGVPNRYYFTLAFDQLVAQRARQQPEARPVVSAILFDLDHFGAVNNERGHETGDRVLAAMGAVLATRLRRADIVARYGGEEFIAILPGTDRDAAVRVANEVRTMFAATSVRGTDDEPIRCTVSAGVAEAPAGEASLDDLLKTADVALIMAKRAGRNQVTAA